MHGRGGYAVRTRSLHRATRVRSASATTTAPARGFRSLPAAGRAYVGGVLVSGAGVAVYSGVTDVHGDSQLALLAVLALFCAGGNLFEIFMPGHWSFQPNLLFFFAGAILLPPWGVAILAVACFLPGYVVNRKKRPDSFPWYKVSFNVANYLLAGMAAHAIANAGDHVPAMADTNLEAVLLLLAAAAAFTVINHGLIVVAVWQAGERSLVKTARQLRDGVPLDAALSLTGACFAVLWDAAPALVILSPGPALLVYRALRAPLLARTADELRGDVGTLQEALLPSVPRRLGALELSVAYRPAEGPGAGGDFYDAVELGNGRVAIVLGDVSGHGRDALARSALMRYTLRAYLEAGLDPRAALAVAGRALDTELGEDFTTVVVAVHDPAAGTLTCASAGHPPPIVAGDGAYEPLGACAAPPIGAGIATGIRQTTLPLRPGTVTCLFTDGVTDATVGGEPVGRDGLATRVAALRPGAGAESLISRIAKAGDAARDDMAACVIRVLHGPAGPGEVIEELDCGLEELAGSLPERFLEECGMPPEEIAGALEPARAAAARSGRGVLLRARVRPEPVRLEVLSDPGPDRIARHRPSGRWSPAAQHDPKATLGAQL